MEGYQLHKLVLRDTYTTGSSAHEARRAQAMSSLTSPTAHGGMGLNADQVHEAITAATGTACELFYSHPVDPDHVSHELFQLLVWQHIYLVHSRDFPWEDLIPVAASDRTGPRASGYAEYHRDAKMKLWAHGEMKRWIDSLAPTLGQKSTFGPVDFGTANAGPVDFTATYDGPVDFTAGYDGPVDFGTATSGKVDFGKSSQRSGYGGADLDSLNNSPESVTSQGSSPTGGSALQWAAVPPRPRNIFGSSKKPAGWYQHNRSD
ncbi:uncharacterized protein B0H64DRAFT_57380 [Chaetomium fimeti]|uniref:Uncharacterized protein n=1 Tax=Chaetomium fimeti TaxID=1854472 RepID=A0AAE0H5N0_9PEZI|nr:hypothetical protein B0H64DRAFT_57380 [Chaetomium fimeti]